MLTYLVHRLAGALLVILGVASIVFLLIHLVPGDPVEIMLGESASTADREALRAALGLDQPVGSQFLQFLAGLFHLDLGTSFHFHRPVSDMLMERLPATGALAGAAFAISLAIAIPVGLLAASRRNTPWDTGAMTFSMLGVSVPNFWLGPILILVFSLWLGWLPVSGREGPGSVILPALTLGTGLAAVLSRMIRSSLLEVLGEDFMRTAKAKGLSPSKIMISHGLRNALLPVITLIGLQLGALLAGAVITETVFSWPGIGLLMIEAIQTRDYPLVQACVLLISFIYVLVNLLTDLAYAWADPRIRLGQPADA